MTVLEAKNITKSFGQLEVLKDDWPEYVKRAVKLEE